MSACIKAVRASESKSAARTTTAWQPDDERRSSAPAKPNVAQRAADAENTHRALLAALDESVDGLMMDDVPA